MLSPILNLLRTGLSLARQGDVQAATAVLQQALRNARDAGDTKRIALIGQNLAIIFYYSGDALSAEHTLRGVLSDIHSDHRTEFQLASMLRELGRKAEANGLFEKALQHSIEEKDWDLVRILGLEGYSE